MATRNPIYRRRISETREKVRNVLIIVWIEELEKLGLTYYDLLGYLDSLHMEFAVSPIHDKDVWDSQGVMDWCSHHIDPTTGDLSLDCIDRAPYVGMPKKKHIHLLCKGSAQHDAYWWCDLLSGLIPDIKPTRWDKCYSVTGSIRYWVHMDSPQKHRYSEWEVIGIGGIDLSCLFKQDDKKKEELANDVYDAIKFYGINYYHELLDTVQGLGDAELSSYVRGTHALWRGYLDSKSRKVKDDAYLDKLRRERAAISKSAGIDKS